MRRARLLTWTYDALNCCLQSVVQRLGNFQGHIPLGLQRREHRDDDLPVDEVEHHDQECQRKDVPGVAFRHEPAVSPWNRRGICAQIHVVSSRGSFCYFDGPDARHSRGVGAGPRPSVRRRVAKDCPCRDNLPCSPALAFRREAAIFHRSEPCTVRQYRQTQRASGPTRRH